MSHWIFTAMLQYNFFNTGWLAPSASCHATAPRPLHAAVLGVAGERTGAAAHLVERGLLEVGLPEAANNHFLFFSFGSAVERSIVDNQSSGSSLAYRRVFVWILE